MDVLRIQNLNKSFKRSFYEKKRQVLHDVSFSVPAQKTTGFVGNNGSGKTNILDAIHYAALTKSFLNYTDRQNIQFDQEYFSIRSSFVDASSRTKDFRILIPENAS